MTSCGGSCRVSGTTTDDMVARGRRDPGLLGVLGVTLVLCTYQLNWGLPNGNNSWAADALGPLTVLSVVRRSLVPLNSGWFYFKYPLGYPLMLLLTYAPYLAFQFLTGRFRHPKAAYPYGFGDPEHALYVLELLGRCLSVACVLGTVALTYDIGRRLFGRTAGLVAAWFVATAYPILYYGHTTNLDASYLFWLILALWGTIVASTSDRRWPYVVLGIAAAMAVSTKEQGFAFLLPLPLIVAFHRHRALAARLSSWESWRAAVWNPAIRTGLVATLITVALANNALANPRGFANRIRYLSGSHVPGVAARLAPVEFALFKGVAKEGQYARQLIDGIESGLGLPLFVLTVAGMMFVAWRRSRAAVYLLVPAAVQYYLSLRTLDLITLRYTLPLSVIGALCAAALCAAALTTRWRSGAAAVVTLLCVFGLARAVEFDLLLRDDSRYDAEQWMQAHASPASSVETYQKPAYLPRLSELQTHEVPSDERTIEGVLERRPDFIVTSSAAKKGITHRWNPNWRPGHPLLVPVPGAPAFMDALETDRLPYRRVAQFAQHPALLRVRITSLCPEISIFQRQLN